MRYRICAGILPGAGHPKAICRPEISIKNGPSGAHLGAWDVPGAGSVTAMGSQYSPHGQ